MAVTDNFNRANGGLGANWTTDSSFSALTIVSNACQGSTGAVHNISVYTASGTFPADQYAQFKVATTGTYMGLVLRSNGAGTFYMCLYQPTIAFGTTIYKCTAGTFSLLTTGSSVSPTVGDVVYFEAVGSALKVKVNGVTVATVTDTAITGAGYTGIDVYDVGYAVDDFEGGTLGAVNVTVNLTGIGADPQIGTGTVTIGSVVVEPPPVSPGGGTGRTGMRLRPAEDKSVYLVGVAANPKVGRVMLLHEMQQAYEAYSAPIRKAEARRPAEMPPGMRRLFKPVEKPIPPALFVYQVGLPKLKSAVGTGTVKAFYEDIDEETIAMIDLL